MANPKLRVDVNHNPTKKGIKVQFVMPQTVEGDAKAEMTQKLQAKLNQGLSQYGLTVSQDTDVPYANVIGFLIPIADVKLMIKKAITGAAAPAPAPETPAAPEEPVAEVRRMKELAGLIIKSQLNEGQDFTVNTPESKTKEEAMKELQSKIDYSKEIDGTFKRFNGVIWVGETTEDDLIKIAFRNADNNIVLGQIDNGLLYAYSKRS